MVWEIYNNNGLVRTQANSKRLHFIHIKHSLIFSLTILLVYVNDMIIVCEDEIEKLTLPKKLTVQFEMKDFRKLKCFLGIKVAYSKKGFSFPNENMHLISSKKSGKLRGRTLGILIEQTHRTGSESVQLLIRPNIRDWYENFLLHTRLDIAYVVSVVSQFIYKKDTCN